MDHWGTKKERYIVIPPPNTTVDVDLVCAIQPGVLTSKYNFMWFRAPLLLLSMTETLSVTVSAGEGATYFCFATIEHINGTDNPYGGPKITVYTKGVF